MAPVPSTRQVGLRSFDALRGPPPQIQDTVSGSRGFAVWSLSLQGALWGAAAGLLAPVTVLLLDLSGLTGDTDETLGAIDYVFFFGFVPLATAIVAVLLALNHWPLRSINSFHREITAALMLIDVVLLAELRLLSGRVTSEAATDVDLFINGSIVIQALILYWLTRMAAGNLTRLHASRNTPRRGLRRAGVSTTSAETGFLPPDTPRYTPTGMLMLHGLMWGIIIATASGAAAGTLLIPVLGTLVGAYFGAIYGLGPVALGALFVVAVVSWRRDTEAVDVVRAVRGALVAVGVAILAGLWPFLQTAAFTPDPWEDAHLVRTWLIVVPVVVLLLRYCAPRLASTYIRLIPRPPATEQAA